MPASACADSDRHTGSVGVRGSSPLSSTPSEQEKRTDPLSKEDGAVFFVHTCAHKRILDKAEAPSQGCRIFGNDMRSELRKRAKSADASWQQGVSKGRLGSGIK